MEIKKAMIIPISGARKIKAAICITGPELTEEKVPACAIAAPANPPIRVWEEEEGMVVMMMMMRMMMMTFEKVTND